MCKYVKKKSEKVISATSGCFNLCTFLKKKEKNPFLLFLKLVKRVNLWSTVQVLKR
jgi:hypothetical protein